MSRLAILGCLIALLALPASAQDLTASATLPESGPAPGNAPAAVESPEAAVPQADTFLVLRSGQQVEGNVRMVPSAHKPRYALVDGQRYEIRDIESYQLAGQKYKVVETPSASAAPAVFAQQTDGRIAIYRETSGHFSTGADYYTVNDGPIRMVTTRSLNRIVEDHPVARQHLQRDRILGHVGMAGLVAGAGIMGVGSAIHFGYVDSPHSGFVIAASGVGVAVVTNTIVPLLQRQARMSAVRAYNR